MKAASLGVLGLGHWVALNLPRAASACNPECPSGACDALFGFIVEDSYGCLLLTSAWAWFCTHGPKPVLLDAGFRVFSRLMSKVLVFFLC